MGTTGGKIGFVLGIASVFAFAPLTIRILVGRCFFEEGCGRSEGTMLLLAGAATLALMIMAGLAVRLVVNRLLGAK